MNLTKNLTIIVLFAFLFSGCTILSEIIDWIPSIDKGYVVAVTSDAAEFVVIYFEYEGPKLYFNPKNKHVCPGKNNEISYIGYDGDKPEGYTLPVRGVITNVDCFERKLSTPK